MVVMETTEEGAAQPKAQAKIILKTKKTKKTEAKTTAKKRNTTANTRTNYSQPWREDRQRSAELVDMLDGGGRRGTAYKTSRSYTTTTPRQSSNYSKYNVPSKSHSGRADRMNSAQLVDMLDGRGAQTPQQRRTKRLNWANEVPMASTRTTYSGIEETTLTTQTPTRGYATAAPQEKPTYVAPSRRPAWDVNVGD